MCTYDHVELHSLLFAYYTRIDQKMLNLVGRMKDTPILRRELLAVPSGERDMKGGMQTLIMGLR